MRGEVLNEFIYDDVGIHERIDPDRKTGEIEWMSLL
jgi:hypothetical protein